MGESLRDRFQMEGFRVDWFRRAGDAERALRQNSYVLLLSDIRLPDEPGDRLFQRCRKAQDFTLPPVIFITGYGSIATAVQLLKAGAADYVVKPFDLDELVSKVEELTRAGVRAAGGEEPSESGVLGISPVMRRVEQQLARLARADAGVLLVGGSGVGKELAARYFHRAGGGSRPFVAVNCGALPESLLEAELFGHERGAFTGAQRSRRGVFEQADGGVLFLDEIGDMPLSMQVRLLRAIQEKQVTRLGSEQSIPLDFTLVSATHRDLRALVAAGSFREDLYYRINTVQIRIPPLRERPEDILWFARNLLEARAEEGSVPRRLSHAAERALLKQDWPGNVRELEHCLQRALLLSDTPVLEPEDLFDELTTPPNAVGEEALADYLRAREYEHIRQALARHGGQITATARSLGISRKNLWEKMRKLAIGNRDSD
ncbi:MAG: sigma-54-dependent Fis family transcriptional regulator [Ectothiorhodospiraceae bacterium]|nr:sigma-54-dependent Fis family transcriptional regulator [Ectothiorhodospiraceae bacterium]